MVVCVFTRYLFAIPLRTKERRRLSLLLDGYVCVHTLPICYTFADQRAQKSAKDPDELAAALFMFMFSMFGFLTTE